MDWAWRFDRLASTFPSSDLPKFVFVERGLLEGKVYVTEFRNCDDLINRTEVDQWRGLVNTVMNFRVP
jgi:hypothetical protein